MREIHVIDARIGTTAEKLRVAAYCRVSSDSDDQLNSFLAQVRLFHHRLYIDQNPEETWPISYADEWADLAHGWIKRDESTCLMAVVGKGRSI